MTDLQKIARATTITAAINTVMNPALLEIFDTAVTAQDIRQVLQDNNAHFGHIDLSTDIPGDSLLTGQQALDIKLAAETRAATITAEQIQRRADVITAIGGVNNPQYLVGIVTAVGARDIRLALHARWGDLGLLNPVADDAVDFILTDQQTADVQREAIAKLQVLNTQTLKAAIAGITDTTNPTLNTIAHIDKAATGDVIRDVLTTHRANLGTIDVSTNVLLTDDAAKEIRTVAIQHFNTLLIKKTVADYALSAPAIFEEIAKTTYGDADAIRDAIRAHRSDFGGAALISTRPQTADFLSNAQAAEVQIFIIQKYNGMVIRQALKSVTYSSTLADLIAVAPGDADAIRRALDTDKAYFGNIDLSRGQDALSDEEARAIHALAIQKHAALIAKPIHRSNVLMEKRDSLLHFTEEKVKAGEAPTSALTSTPGIAAAQAKPGATIYEGQYLDKEHKIVSRRTFDVPSVGATPAASVVGTLEQDHTGKVTDATEAPDKLQESDRALLALKQAQMLLTNYTPGSGDIIISGTDVAQANKVYAALLYLKDKNPLLEPIKIKSFVYGCNGPSGWIKSQAKGAFIKEHLKSLPRDVLESVKQQTNLIVPTVAAIHTETTRKQSELEALTRAGTPTATIKAKIAELQQAELQEGKEISTGRGGGYKKS